MCLIVLAWRVRPDLPLIVAANRDEFHARPAEGARFWHDQPAILAGRDLQAGGAWLGVSRSGRFAAVTNYRGGGDPNAAQSRGVLVVNFLRNDFAPNNYISSLNPASYSGFNLLLADRDEMWWFSNRDGGSHRLDPGSYGLGNFSLDTPEISDSKQRFSDAIEHTPSIEPLFSVLAPSRILAPDYGTRCSTVLIAERDGRTQFVERPFDAQGTEGSTRRYEFRRAG